MQKRGRLQVSMILRLYDNNFLLGCIDGFLHSLHMKFIASVQGVLSLCFMLNCHILKDVLLICYFVLLGLYDEQNAL